MRTAEDIVQDIVHNSRIPSSKRRRELERELRAHMEDFTSCAREAGHDEDQIQRLLIANFGDPAEVAGEFSSLYRRERTFLRILVFLLSTLAAALSSAVAALLIQAGLTFGLGEPANSPMHLGHLVMEGFYVAATAAAYVSLTSLEGLFRSGKLEKSVAAIGACFLVPAIALSGTAVVGEMLFFGCVSGIILRLIQIRLHSRTARGAAIAAVFGLVGLISLCQSPNMSGMPLKVGTWIALGMCLQFMTHVATRVNRVLLSRVEA